MHISVQCEASTRTHKCTRRAAPVARAPLDIRYRVAFASPRRHVSSVNTRPAQPASGVPAIARAVQHQAHAILATPASRCQVDTVLSLVAPANTRPAHPASRVPAVARAVHHTASVTSAPRAIRCYVQAARRARDPVAVVMAAVAKMAVSALR
jgi:hypothetical protein